MLETSEAGARAEMELVHAVAHQAGAGFHGGALMTLADHTAATACGHALNPTGEDEPPSTALLVQFNAHIVRNTREGKAIAEARVINKGRTMILVETTVRDDQGRVLLLATSTHAVVARGG
jgi:1,4-dihydroxy-2-naphthoyl-CoA hydrolase